MLIKAAVVRDGDKPFFLENVELEPPRGNEVLVRIAGVGICHTDVKMKGGARPIPMPIVLGHEGAGVVKAVGARVTKVAPGDHVVLTYNSCGICPNCQSGQASYCYEVDAMSFGGQRPDGSSPISQNGEIIHGYFFGQSSFADHAIATERNVVKVSHNVPLEMLGPLGCGIQTGAGAVLNSLDVEPGASLVVFGVGSVGLSAVMAGCVAGCSKIIAVDQNPQRLYLATELGATDTIRNDENTDVVTVVNDICPGGVNYVLDTTGNPGVLRLGVECLKSLGTCGMIGGAPKGVDVALPMQHMLAGRVFRGIIQGDSIPDIFIPTLIDLYTKGRFPFDRLITYYPLADINQAVADMHAGRTIKPVLKPDNYS